MFLRVTDGPVLLPFKRLREDNHQNREQKCAGNHKRTTTDLCARVLIILVLGLQELFYASLLRSMLLAEEIGIRSID